MTSDSLLIVIPARGGSQRLTRKALRPVAGRALLWYTFDYVRWLGLSQSAVVITDDAEIADYTRVAGGGIGVVREPPVERESAPRAVYRAVQAARTAGTHFTHVCHLQPTCPVRSVDLVGRCLRAVEPPFDTAISVVNARIHPEWCMQIDANGLPTTRGRGGLSQELPQWYEPSGCCYCYRAEVFDLEPPDAVSFIAQRTRRAVVHDDPHCDIDTQADLDWFEYLVRTGRTIWRPV